MRMTNLPLLPAYFLLFMTCVSLIGAVNYFFRFTIYLQQLQQLL